MSCCTTYYFVTSLVSGEFLPAGSQHRDLLKQLYGLVLVSPDKGVSLSKSCLSQAVLSCPQMIISSPRVYSMPRRSAAVSL